jgi:hypothetical protein
MRVKLLALAAALATASLTPASLTPASATVLISDDNGGKMSEYASHFQQVSESGEQVVIDGTCLSACTMVLGLVPRNRVCVTPNAVLGFHAAWQPDGNGGRVTSRPATSALLGTYPPAIRAWIARRGGLTPQMMFLRGRELAGIVPLCGGTPRETYAARPRGGRHVRQAFRPDLRRSSIAER